MRAGIYYRVSSEEQIDGFSLDAQRRILLDYCAQKGWQVIEEYADEGKSARTDQIAKRPAFKRMLEDAEASLLDVVVVHKIDRFARNIRVTFECLELLARHRVAFVAVAQPDLDYTRPEGRLFMGMMATLAQYYSDNLSQETKKGKAERKAQGLYNGHIPFGMMKGPDAVPLANPDTIEGLRLAFRLATEGQSDRQIAQALNAAGYRTQGNRGNNPFTKDTVCAILQNRFYLGELPGQQPGERVLGQHAAVIDRDIFDAAQEARERRATSRHIAVPRGATAYSLSGLGVCWHCGGRLQIQRSKSSIRLYCANKRQGLPCASKSGTLEQYDDQLAAHLTTFTIPPDYREQLRAYVASEEQVAEDTTARRQRIETRLARIKELYGWGDLGRAEYLTERDLLLRDLAALDARESQDTAHLDRLAELLGDTVRLWGEANQEQRNRIAGLLFEEVVIKDEQIVAVKPRPELAGFFALDCARRGVLLGETAGPVDILVNGACKPAEVTGNGSASPTRSPRPLASATPSRSRDDALTTRRARYNSGGRAAHSTNLGCPRGNG